MERRKPISFHPLRGCCIEKLKKRKFEKNFLISPYLFAVGRGFLLYVDKEI